MIILNLKPLIFLLLLALSVVVAWIVLMRRSPRSGIALRDTTALLSMLDAAPFGLLILDAANATYANAHAQRLLRLPGTPGPLPDTDWLPLLDADRLAVRQSEAEGRYRTLTFASGMTARWWVSTWDARDFVFLLDITAQQRTEQASRALLNDLAHELRTPIATILTHLEILGLPDVSAEVRTQSLSLAQDEAQRMARLLNAMLALARLETAPELPRRPLDIVALVEDVVLQSTPRTAECQMTLALEAASPLPLINGNADRLRQVFLNLLDNAFKYARPGDSVTVTLQALAENEGPGVRCAVCDTGPGIGPEHLPYIARRFYRAAPQSIPGSGLGLALVTEIVRRHHSEVRVASPGPDGVGTCVRFSLHVNS